MALITMAVYSTEENQKDKVLKLTLESLMETVDWRNSRLILSINSKTEKTEEIIKQFKKWLEFSTLHNKTNLGTAEAINLGFKTRKNKEYCIKMDDDVIIHDYEWVEQLEEVMKRDNSIGICGLKRKDCIENPNHEDPYYKSNLIQLPHLAGERWVIVEEVHHVMGTCQMYSPELLDKIGYLYQPKLYGWDDVLASARSKAEGFKNVFLPHIQIDHIDEGKTPFQQWKECHAWESIEEINRLMEGYKNGSQSTYYNPYEN